MAGNMDVIDLNTGHNEAAVFITLPDVGGATHDSNPQSTSAETLQHPTDRPTERPPPASTETPAQSVPIATNTDAVTTSNSSSKKGGLSPGAKIGLGVAIPVILILLGVGVFLLFRRRQKNNRLKEKRELDENMIIVGKHGQHLDEDQGSVPSGPGGTFMHPSSSSPPQAPNGQMYAPTATQESGAYDAGIVPSPAPMMTPVTARSPVDEIMNRPVSPVHDEDLLTEGHTSHGSAGATAAGSLRERGSVGLDEDREMQWILEEERKAKERREQQGRLPTHGA